MTKPKTENYEIAAQLIADGTWSVDTQRGILIGMLGNPYRRTNTNGYIQVKFVQPGVSPRVERTVLAHRVIYEAEHGPLSRDMTVNHINGDHTDNRVANLEPMSQADNVKHAVRTGLYHANCIYCRDHGKNHNAKI